MIKLIFYLIVILLFLIYYVFGKFAYKVQNRHIIVQRTILGILPFGTRSIPFSEIKDIRRYGRKGDWVRGADVYGNLFWKPAVLIILKNGFFRRVFITPSSTDEFIKNARLQIEMTQQISVK
jgi:hypothetical protein